MKAFRFRLDAALRWRSTQLQLEQEAVSRAASQLASLQTELSSRYSDLRSGAAELASVGGVAFESWAFYADRCRRRIQVLEGELQQARKTLAQSRQKMTQAHQKVRVLEKLKESKFTEWARELDRETDAFAGEVFLARLQSKNGRARSSVG